jgi:putative Ca2+/H+ antiporter (TMEM165/GDT1 family)
VLLDVRVLAYVFGAIFVAELPDKTALAALVLATRHKPLPVFVGAAVALTVQSVIAIAAGSLVSLLPERAVHIGSGALFLGSAWFMWRRKEEDGETEGKESRGPVGFWRAAWVTFGVVFVAEWGDLTQLATAAMAARFKAPLTVFAGATLALWAVAAIAVFVGSRAGKLLDPALTQKVAAVVFVLIGVALIAGIL